MSILTQLTATQIASHHPPLMRHQFRGTHLLAVPACHLLIVLEAVQQPPEQPLRLLPALAASRQLPVGVVLRVAAQQLGPHACARLWLQATGGDGVQKAPYRHGGTFRCKC